MKDKVERNQQEVLLKEYEVCQQHNDSIGSQVWIATSVFMSVNVALLGAVIYSMTGSSLLERNIRCLVLVLGAGIIAILHFWKRWLNRMQFLTSINYERMREIEDELGMRKNKIAWSLDHWDGLTEEEKEKYKKLNEQYPRYGWWKFLWKRFPKYAPPRGFEGSRSIVWILIMLWIIFIVLVFTL
ncbi:MAG: hypothetical protein HXY36_01855 [Chloroflexi bacterium]|nr:hypothetical protein [Chloroflexota bacterium]